MKKTLLKSVLFLCFTISTVFASAQTPNKEQLIKEVNQLLTSCKMWDYEGIVMDNGGSFKYHICLNPECNPFVSWDFFIKNLKSIELGKLEEYKVINFICGEKDCIVPTGYEKGGRYEPKNDLQFIIKDEKQAKELVAKLNTLKAMEFSK